MNSANNSTQQAKGQVPKTQVNISTRQLGGRSAGGSRVKQQTSTTLGGGWSSAALQQQQLSGNTSIPIINAPTSLTNLAQLSGITLLPVGNMNNNSRQQNLSYNLPPIASIQASPSYIITSQPNNTNTNNSNSTLSNQQQRKQKPSVSQTSIATNANGQQQPIYNLSNIPSIQLLNQASTITDALHWRTDEVLNDNKNQLGIRVQSSRTSPKTNDRANVKRTKVQSNNYIHLIPKSSDIHVIPVTEGLQMYADVSDMQPTQSGSSFDDILSQPSLESLSEEQCADVDGDMNNISLVKLMAIFNNPALTITAVDSKNDPRSTKECLVNMTEDDQPSSATVNFIDSQRLGNLGRSCQTNNDYYHNNSMVEPQTAQMNQIFMSQSAANLDMIHGEAIDCLPVLTTKRGTLSGNANKIKESARFPQQTYKSVDLQPNWLSNYNSEGLTSTGGKPASISWSNSSNNFASTTKSGPCFNDKLNDPSMLSTSVRNLLMQQLPTGTKNSTVSVQLLKHIANQTKDNNWTSNQPQKDTVLEPECIVDVVSRNVHQLNQGAKRVESQKTVTISSMKKKPLKKPLLTTKDRLFVPRTNENTSPTSKRVVSEPKFDLSAISIDQGEEREVHVSEQHFILESMMSNGDSAQRSTMPEPDEIFINRSKRIMSKIDTMIERKKRRRFERISGRAAPKTNSLEEQCAESEEEWSTEEDMDVEFDGLIKSQLPLDEIETNEKKDFLCCVGLVSRQHKNKLSLQQCEEKFKIFSPLSFEETREVPEVVKRFVDVMLKTGGTDIQLRTDSNIKRNDLPLIEGLNRNTSRMKMNYMNVLGLEKRSKRTTLYKVKPMENLDVQLTARSTDLNKISKSAILGKQLSVEPEVAGLQSATTNGRLAGNNFVLSAKISLTSCREALKPPSKNEYMKSLGLIAS